MRKGGVDLAMALQDPIPISFPFSSLLLSLNLCQQNTSTVDVCRVKGSFHELWELQFSFNGGTSATAISRTQCVPHWHLYIGTQGVRIELSISLLSFPFSPCQSFDMSCHLVMCNILKYTLSSLLKPISPISANFKLYQKSFSFLIGKIAA